MAPPQAASPLARVQQLLFGLIFAIGYRIYRSRLGLWLHTLLIARATPRRERAELLATAEGVEVYRLAILSDNYTFLIVDRARGACVAVDPADPDRVLEAVDALGVPLAAVLCTHTHWDHAGGNEALLGVLGADALDVFGPPDDGTAGLTHPLDPDQDRLTIGSLWFQIMRSPGHTRGHVMYLLDDGARPILFSGDCLFVGGCGRVFEGTYAEAKESLDQLRTLPPDTLVCCGHENTHTNLEFGRSVDPRNEALAAKLEWTRQQRRQGLATVPSTIREELEHNVFLRATTVDEFERLRRAKDGFKSPPLTVDASDEAAGRI